jgi:nucleoside triphosphate diphosphatase
MTKIAELIELVKLLRDPNAGDPWILKQNFHSLNALTIEEAYEFADSVEQNDFEAMCDELGDLLLHILLYAQLATEIKQFDLNQIIQKALDKQRRRKLSFANPENITEKEALDQWEKIKKTERTQHPQNYTSALDGIAANLPSINRAIKLQLQAAQVNFDWPDTTPIFEKFTEELAEIQEVLDNDLSKEKLTEEVGDLLFTAINLARKLNVNPDAALRYANNKFEKRFRSVENELKIQGKTPETATLMEMEKIWKRIKYA